MTYEETMRALGIEVEVPDWAASWSHSDAPGPPDEARLISPAFVHEACRFLGMGSDVQRALLEALPGFDECPAIRRLWRHCRMLLFTPPGVTGAAAHRWPVVSSRACRAGPLLHVFALLAGLPDVRERDRRRGIPEAVTVETLDDLEWWIREHRRLHGEWGFSELVWLVAHFSGELYRLGRLQFLFERFAYPYRAFRHRQRGDVVFLAGAGMRFRPDGQAYDADGRLDSSAPAAVVEGGGGSVSGTLILPTGRTAAAAVRLPASDWEPVLGYRDPVLGVHITGDRPMDHAECGASFRAAVEFFPRHFADRPFRAFSCRSWLLDPQLEDVLPDSANLVRFLREWYLFPLPQADSRQTFARVFGDEFVGLDQAPQRTALQRAIVHSARQGTRWRSAGGVIFPDRLQWGAQVYRTRFHERLANAGLDYDSLDRRS